MKNFYPHGHVVPSGDGSGERHPRRRATVRRAPAEDLSTAPRTYSLVKFNSYRKRGKAGSPPATTSNPYDVLKKVDWLAIFSPWAIINRSKMYTISTKQTTCADRTPANNAALQNFEKRQADAQPVVSNRACELSEGKFFSGEFYGGGINSKGLHELASRGFGSFFAENHEVLMHAIKKPILMHKKERPVAACPDPSGASDGKVAGRVNTTLSSITIYSPFPSTLHLLLLPIFVSIFICFSGAAKAQSRQDVGAAEAVVTGKVVSASSGRPIQQVTIVDVASQKQASSDPQGVFKLIVSEDNGHLVISCVGYKTDTVQFHVGTTSLDIKLQPQENILDEAIVIGYGTTTRRLSTGSVHKVSNAELEVQPISNPILALQGLVPGLDITPETGISGGVVDLKIRGDNSLTQGSAPLILLDGNPIAIEGQQLSIIGNAASGLSVLNHLNSHDIESIEVLKDADATSIYGSRGANGVILITTKKNMQEGMLFDFAINSGFSTPGNTIAFLNTEEYFLMREEGLRNSGLELNELNSPDLVYWDNTVDTDYRNFLAGAKSQRTNMNFSARGGSQNTKFRVSASKLAEGFQVQSDRMSGRTSFGVDLSHRAFENRVSLSFLTNYSTNTSNLTVYDPSAFLYLPPHTRLHNEDGSLNWALGPQRFSSVGLVNPHAQLSNVYDGKFKSLFSNLSVSYRVLDDLVLKISGGYGSNQGNEYSIFPSTGIDPASTALPSSRLGLTNAYSWIIEPQLDYRIKIGRGSTTVLIGGSVQQSDRGATSLIGSDYSDDVFLGSIATAGRIVPNYSESIYKYAAVFGRLGYDLDRKYLLNISMRRDGSSRFGTNRQYATFYSIGAAWIFSDERFFEGFKNTFSYAKLRGSYGITGNDQIGNYKFMDTWNSSTDRYAGVLPVTPSALYNPDYSWEKNVKAEIAIDFGALNDRLLATISYYRNVSGNQLIDYFLPNQTGFSNVTRNLDAEVQNTGVEISVEGSLIQHRDFVWNTRIALSRPRNKLTKFPDLEESPYASYWVIDQPLSMRRLYQYSGIDTETGIYSFVDADDNGVLDDKDLIACVHFDPMVFGGLTSTFRYKNLNLGISLDFKRQKGNSYMANLISTPGYGLSNQPRLVLDRWQKPGDRATFQRFAASVSDPAFAAMRTFVSSDGAVSDASFIRLKNINIAYNRTLNKKSWIRSFDVHASAQNLKTWSPYIGGDPEIQNILATPPMRTIVIGTKLFF